MSVAAYATLTGLRLRLHGPEAGSSPEDGLLQEICNEVNNFIEGPTGAARVLGPIPPFSVEELTADFGDRSLTLSSVAGLAAGDRLLIGTLDADHEYVTVLAIEANETPTAPDWADGTYSVGDRVQPTTPNSHTYRCVLAGDSDATEPTFPTDGSAVIDNEVVWLDEGVAEAIVHLNDELVYSYVAQPAQRVMVADGDDAIGRGLKVRSGILALAAVEVGGSLPAFTLRPTGDNLRPGWPHTHVVLRSEPFPSGIDNVHLIGPGPCVDLPDLPAFGFPFIPDGIKGVAYSLAAARYQMRASGGTYDIAPGSGQVQVGQFLLSRTDYAELRSYSRDFGIA